MLINMSSYAAGLADKINKLASQIPVLGKKAEKAIMEGKPGDLMWAGAEISNIKNLISMESALFQMYLGIQNEAVKAFCKGISENRTV